MTSMSRRAILRGGAAVGLTAAGLTALPTLAAAATQPKPGWHPDSSGHLVLDYQPSQPTGWSPTEMSPTGNPVGVTIGGHTAATDFPFNNKNYRISLLPLGQSGDAPDPVYRGVPGDPEVNYQQTLDQAFGKYYSFDYTGGFAGRHEFSVQSYSVMVDLPTATLPMLGYGTNLFFRYEPDPRHGDPASQANPQFIQVVRWVGSGPQGSLVDNAGRANPFFIWGGLTSVYGVRSVSFNDTPQTRSIGGPNATLSEVFHAETFLVQDTGCRDRTGRDVVRVFGGINWGWQVAEI